MNPHLIVEKRIIDWFKRKRFKLYLVAILTILLWLAPLTPYINILITYELSIFLIIVSFLYISDLSIRLFTIIVTLLFLFCMFYHVLGQIERADFLANYTFGIIFIQTLIYMFRTYGKKTS